MRYHKEKRPEIEGIPTGEEMSDREREAERILSRSLAAARDEAPQTATPLTVVRTVVEARARRRTAMRERSFMSAITRPLTTHRRLSFGVVLAVLVFAFATLVPFEYQQTIGYEATYAGIDPTANFSLERLETALGALGYNDAEYSLHTTRSGVLCQVSGLPSKHAVREVTAAMASVAGFDGEPKVRPLVETVSGSLYAQVKCGLTALDDFDFDGKTDEGIKAEIEQRLAAEGCDNAEVIIRSKDTDDGKEKRQICVQVRDESGSSGAICSVGFLDGLDLDAENKTDAELEEIIRQRCIERGHTDVEVSVTTRADGKRRIEMKCKPKDD